ncbi:MAG: ATP-dependent 6-phosphofructokinase [Methanosarcinaceae archaeon]|nr:ATP-dependent 6-phosphofructokinase [Methanosarcinaceae archaeon]MDF1533569.1 ATP-dependent 6-phosphofructokinase [Methanosarcinaceae archaeon]
MPPLSDIHELHPIEKELLGYDLSVRKLGECLYESNDIYLNNKFENQQFYVPDNEHILAVIDKSSVESLLEKGIDLPAFEKAGPKKKLFFELGKATYAIVTCGGLCPGLNSVISGIVMLNFFRYNNKVGYGIRYGYAGFIKENGHEVIPLTPEFVEFIHSQGGTVLGSSRGPQDTKKIVDRLVELEVKILYAIGGDGTLRGALDIAGEIEKRGLKIAVIGIPKTIDNDINFIDKSFGMETAFSEACVSIYAAHVEARSAVNGIGIVKVMGRESGFIAVNATLATNDANYCLIPEMEFELEGEKGFLRQLEKRLLERKHAVIVVSEGVGQKYVSDPDNPQYDLSGNVKLLDFGIYLKERIEAHLKTKNIPTTIKYLDPSYSIRSRPPTPNDSIFCLQLSQMAVHAGMSGRTGMLVGIFNGQFTHLPMEIVTAKRKKVDLDSQLWHSVLQMTGQPASFKNE